VLRFANVYGPRQSATLEGGVVAIFLERLAAGQQTAIFGDGEQSRDFVHVEDVVGSLLAATDRNGGVFNVGTAVETTVAELHALCARVVGVDAQPAREAARPGDARRSVLDPEHAAAALGWRASIVLDDGIAKTAAAVRED
jgi:UDP-glucose 4-epimerase